MYQQITTTTENITKHKQITRKMQSKPTTSTLVTDSEGDKKSGSLRGMQPMKVAYTKNVEAPSEGEKTLYD
jgi:hypothetical protein